MRRILLFILVVLSTGAITSCNNSTSKGNEKDDSSAIRYSNMHDIKAIIKENQDYVILDVRTLDEYQEGHIPGAINIPNENIANIAGEKLTNKEQLILVYCRSGNRSKQAAKTLANMGYTNIIEFGGIIDWDGDLVFGVNPY
jgi:rhodanese-related sulfurtransferase